MYIFIYSAHELRVPGCMIKKFRSGGRRRKVFIRILIF